MLGHVRSALVIEPHPDDLAIGCGGLVQRLVAQGAAVHVLLATAVPPEGRKIRDGLGEYARYSGAERMAEWERASSLLGLSSRRVAFGHEWHHRLDVLPRVELLAAIEAAIRETQPDLLLVPERSSDQDHLAVHDAALAALRPHLYRGTALAYETCMERDFEPTAVVELDEEQVRRKLEACRAYATQMGGPLHPYSVETVEATLRQRGRLVFVPAAEAFRVIRATCLIARAACERKANELPTSS